MQKYENNIQDQFGNEITGATITVRNVVGGALASLFSDDAVTPLANPFAAQSGSEFFFYATNGRYDVFITGPVTDSFLDAILFDQAGTPASIPIDLLDNEQIRFGTGQDTLMFFDGTNFILQAVAGNLTFDGEVFATGSIYVTEKAAAGADTLTLGQFWVRDDAPNLPMFTDDLGNDFILNAGLTIPIILLDNEQLRFGTGADVTIDWDGVDLEIEGAAANQIINFRDGFNIRVWDSGDTDYGAFFHDGTDVWIDGLNAANLNISSAFTKVDCQADSIAMQEVANAPGDVVGQGQFWVQSEAPNVPMFTSDTGIDILIDPGISDVNEQNGNYEFVLLDKGRTVRKASGGAGETYTIPAEASVAFRIGTLIGIDNDGGGDLTLAITTDTLVNGDDNTTGSITIGDGGGVVIKKTASAEWKALGSQMS